MKMKFHWVKLALATLGLLVVSGGAALCYPPAGLIVLGAGLIAATMGRERSEP